MTMPDDIKAFITRNNAPFSKKVVVKPTATETFFNSLEQFFQNYCLDKDYNVEQLSYTEANGDVCEYVVVYRWHGQTLVVFPMYVSDAIKTYPVNMLIATAFLEQHEYIEPQPMHVCDGMRIEPAQATCMSDEQLHQLSIYITTAILNDIDYSVSKRTYAPLPPAKMSLEVKRIKPRINLFGRPVRTDIAVNVLCEGQLITGVEGYIDYVRKDIDVYCPMFVITHFPIVAQDNITPLLLLGLWSVNALHLGDTLSTFATDNEAPLVDLRQGAQMGPLMVALDIEPDGELYWATSVFIALADGNSIANDDLLKALNTLSGGIDSDSFMQTPVFVCDYHLITLGDYKDAVGVSKDIRTIDRSVMMSTKLDLLLELWDQTTSGVGDQRVERDKLLNCMTRGNASVGPHYARRLLVNPKFLQLLSETLIKNNRLFRID